MIGIDPESDGLARAKRLGVPTSSDGHRRPAGHAALRRYPAGLRRHLRRRARQALEHAARQGCTRPRPDARRDRAILSCRWSISRTTSTRRTSTWSPAAGRPPCRSSPPSAGRRRCPTPRSCHRSRRSRPVRGPGPTSTSSPRRPLKRSKVVGGAQRSKAVIILNPADPPILMRSTVYCLVEGDCDHAAVHASVTAMVTQVQQYVAGLPSSSSPCSSRRSTPTIRCTSRKPAKFIGTRVTALLQVTGAAHYLPAYAGNLDIMTSAALATAERIAARSMNSAGALK